MNSTRASTPPNSNFDLPNRYTDLNRTLGIIGTPHEESIDMILSTKTSKSRGIEENPPGTPLTLDHRNPKIEPLIHGFREGNQRQYNHKGFPSISPIKSERARSRKHTEKTTQERAPKITTKNNREQHNKALRNHAESSIHTKEVHTRSSLLPDHPTLSKNLTMKLSS
jgi:hypothetical protein